MNHPTTYTYRTLFLQTCLSNKSKYVRDGARLGLYYLNNPSTIQSLIKAAEVESSIKLKEKILFVINHFGYKQ
jgi:hypothetical protein